jgi:hypothetical protein
MPQVFGDVFGVEVFHGAVQGIAGVELGVDKADYGLSGNTEQFLKNQVENIECITGCHRRLRLIYGAEGGLCFGQEEKIENLLTE